MAAYNWDLSIIWDYREAFIKGTIITIEVTIISIIIGTVLALILGTVRNSKNKLLSKTATIVIETIRGLPFLVLIIWIYFSLPLLISMNIPSFIAAIIALSINLGGYGAEIIRAGMESIPKGQTDAAKTLGLTKLQIFTRITLPQAMRIVISPLTGQYLHTLKNSAMASVIALTELLHQSNNLISLTYRPLEVYTTVAIIYLLLSIPFTYFSHKFEYKKMFSRRMTSQ